MTDMTAFERQLSGEISDLMGPVLPVDDAAIFTAMTTTQSPKWRLQSTFSGLKVVAAAMVVLFGGLLLAAVLTQPSDVRQPGAAASATASNQPRPTMAATTMARSDVLSGVDLVVEEVGPNVYRVLSDGVRELAAPAIPTDAPRLKPVQPGAIVAGLDGSVRVFRKDRFFQLGDVADVKLGRPVPKASIDRESGKAWPKAADDIEVGPDGIVWDMPVGGSDWTLRSFDGQAWTTRVDDPSPGLKSVEILPGGSALVTQDAWDEANEDNLFEVFRLEAPDRRVALGTVPGAAGLPDNLAIGANGEAWHLPGNGPIVSFDGEAWRGHDMPDGYVTSMDAGPDGTVWVNVVPRHPSICFARPAECGRPTVLARLDGTTWTTFGPEDGIPPMGSGFVDGEGSRIAVAPDGSVWLNPDDDAPEGICEGIANFDGVRLLHYLAGTCVWDWDVAPDGSAWLLGGAAPQDPEAEEQPMVDVYVITPDAGVSTGS